MSGKRNWKRERLTLDQAMRCAGMIWTGGAPKNIKFDPKVKPNAVIHKGCSHDGTLIFSMQLMSSALSPFLCDYVILSTMEPPKADDEIIYTFGEIKRAVVFGGVTVNGNRLFGQRERVFVPVLIEIRKNEAAP